MNKFKQQFIPFLTLFYGIRAFKAHALRFLFSSSVAMASSSSLPTVMTNLSPPNLTFHEKLEGPNYLSWLTQFSPILRSTDSMAIVDGTKPCPHKFLLDENNKQVPNPEFVLWQRKDQTILSWINITLSKKVLSTIYGLETSRQVWTSLASQFANQSKTRVANLKKQLQSLHQAPKSCAEYLQSAKEYADQLAAVGQPIPDEELVTYISNGLNSSYNSFITTISILFRDKILSFEDFQEELLNHEMLINHQQTKMADTSTFSLFNQKQATYPSLQGLVEVPFRSSIPSNMVPGLMQQPPLLDTMLFLHLLVMPLPPGPLSHGQQLLLGPFLLMPLGFPAKSVANLIILHWTVFIE
jgi:hypothetical protein